MSEVRKFEMLKVARAVPRCPNWLIAIYAVLGLVLLKEAFEDGKQMGVVFVVGFLILGLGYRYWAIRQPEKYLEMTSEKIRGPLGSREWGEIPRDQVEEVVATTEGLIIAWKKNGVPWYTEVMEMWFSAEEWEKVRAALMEWGNRKAEVDALTFNRMDGIFLD